MLEKNTRLHLQAHIDPLPLLFAFNHQNYDWSLTKHHVELTNLSIEKFQTFCYLKTFGRGATHRGNKFSTILGDLVGEVTINREVKVTGGFWFLFNLYLTSKY